MRISLRNVSKAGVHEDYTDENGKTRVKTKWTIILNQYCAPYDVDIKTETLPYYGTGTTFGEFIDKVKFTKLDKNNSAIGSPDEVEI